MPCAPQWIDVQAILSHVPLFAGMTPGGLARLTRATREIHATRGSTLFRKDELCNGLYLMIFGRVKLVFLTPQGGEKILDILVEGSVFCESTMFLGKKYQVYAQALSDCYLLHISKTGILEELEDEPALARRVIESLSQRLFERTGEIESYSLHSGRQRVMHYLLREIEGARNHGLRYTSDTESACSDGLDSTPVITLMTSKSAIASRLNLTQEHFSRVLHDLSELGLIFVDGRNIYVRDVRQLRIAAV